MKKTRFSTKLVCYIVVVSLLALLISTFMVRARMTDILEGNMRLTSQQTMDEAVVSFQRYAKTLSLPIDLMCRSNDFKQLNEDYDNCLKGVEDSLLSALKVIPNSERTYYSTESGKYISAKLVVSEDNKKTGDYTEQDGVNNSEQPWYADALGLEARGANNVFANFTTPYSNEDGVEVFTVSQDLKASDVHVGVVAMDVNVEVLQDYIDGIQLMNTGFTFLTDKDGNIIINSDKNKLIKNAADIPEWQKLMSGLDKSTEGLSEEEAANANPLSSEMCTIGGEKYCVTVMYDGITGWYLVGMINEAEELANSFRKVNIVSIIGVVIALILSVLVALFIASSIAKELKKLRQATERMAEGDLSTKLEVKRRDEFGQLEHNFNIMIDSISGLITNVEGNSEEIYAVARAVLEVSDNTKEVAEQVTAAIGSVAQGATEQAQSTAEANVEVEKLAESLELSKDKVESIGERSRDTEQIGIKGAGILQELISKSEKAKANSAESMATMTEMLKSIEKINYISDVIADITSQTNLLSLNASIEAARAGEGGKGFAVVADEIRNLADQSRESTEEIKSILSEITSNSTQVESSLEESGIIQEEQQKSIKETQMLFVDIEASVKALLEAVEDIENLNRNMDAARDNVVKRMENIAGVSETSAAATEEVNASAEQVNDTMAQVAEQARTLDTIVHRLDESIKQFKLVGTTPEEGNVGEQ